LSPTVVLFSCDAGVQIASMKTILLLLLCLPLSLTGCATNATVQRMRQDPALQRAAVSLTRDYLEDQKKGGLGNQFGPGVSRFYNLAEYNIVDIGWEWGSPAVFVRVKAGNQIGGNPVWDNFTVSFSHGQELENSGDRYMSLRISRVGKSLVKY